MQFNVGLFVKKIHIPQYYLHLYFFYFLNSTGLSIFLCTCTYNPYKICKDLYVPLFQTKSPINLKYKNTTFCIEHELSIIQKVDRFFFHSTIHMYILLRLNFDLSNLRTCGQNLASFTSFIIGDECLAFDCLNYLKIQK